MYPDKNPSAPLIIFAQMLRFQPLADYLSRETGIEVRLAVVSSDRNIIEHIRTRGIDAALPGSFTSALAISQLGAIPVARHEIHAQ